MARDSETGLQVTTAYLRTPAEAIGDISDLDIENLHSSIENQIDIFNQRGSGSNLLYIKKFVVQFVNYNPLIGSSFIETPDRIKRKKAMINVQNSDQECFKWAVFSAQFPSCEKTLNVFQTTNRSPIGLIFPLLKYPVTLSQIRDFERLNKGFTVNVYVHFKNEHIIPVYLTKQMTRPKHIDLMLLKNDRNSHFVGIKNMSRLVNSRTQHDGRTYVYPQCAFSFTLKQGFENHFPDCSKHMRQKYIFPEDLIIQFEEFHKTELQPFLIYCDFESTLAPTKSDPLREATFPLNTHEMSGFCFYTVSSNNDFPSDPIIYSGPVAMEVFF
jgi:hypothetical protein